MTQDGNRVDWGYHDRNLDPKWFFDQILQRFDLNDDERMRYAKLFYESPTETDEQFDNKLGKFINEYIVDNDIGDRIQQTMDRFALPRLAPRDDQQEIKPKQVIMTKKISDDVWEAIDEQQHPPIGC